MGELVIIANNDRKQYLDPDNCKFHEIILNAFVMRGILDMIREFWNGNKIEIIWENQPKYAHIIKNYQKIDIDWSDYREYDYDSEIVYHEALELWGKELQLNMVFEELGELISTLSRVIRGRTEPDKLAEEIADAEIMLEQLKIIYNNDKEVEDAKIRKIHRLRKRIEKTTEGMVKSERG